MPLRRRLQFPFLFLFFFLSAAEAAAAASGEDGGGGGGGRIAPPPPPPPEEEDPLPISNPPLLYYRHPRQHQQSDHHNLLPKSGFAKEEEEEGGNDVRWALEMLEDQKTQEEEEEESLENKHGGREEILSQQHAFRSALESSLSASVKNVTCPELNTTFTSAPPFDVLGLPQCGDRVKPNMELYLPGHNQTIDDKSDGTKDVGDCMLDPFHLPNKNTSDCLARLKASPKLDRVVVVIHGYLKTFTSSTWMHEYRKEIQEVQPGAAVILIGWDRSTWSFWTAAANTRYIAQAMYLVLKELHRALGASNDIPVHCIGHSLGSHACGFAGKHLVADPDRDFAKKLTRISGLDPAGPLFTNDVPYPFDRLHVSPDARLGPHDADIVDCVHTDGHARYLGWIPQYGTLEPLGVVDFYPGKDPDYGHDQPGCMEVVNIIACSHSRAHEIYGVTIKNASCPVSADCHGDPKDIPKNCVRRPNKLRGVQMGYWWDLGDPSPGLYILEETKTYPYCSLPVKRKISKSDLFKAAGRRRKLARKEPEMQKYSRQDQGEDYDEEENVDKGLEVQIEIGKK